MVKAARAPVAPKRSAAPKASAPKSPAASKTSSAPKRSSASKTPHEVKTLVEADASVEAETLPPAKTQVAAKTVAENASDKDAPAEAVPAKAAAAKRRSADVQASAAKVPAAKAPLSTTSPTKAPPTNAPSAKSVAKALEKSEEERPSPVKRKSKPVAKTVAAPRVATKTGAKAAAKPVAKPAANTGCAPITLGFLSDFVGFHLRLAQDASYRAFARFKDKDLIKPGRFPAMAIIHLNPGISQSALGRAIARDKSTVSPLIKDLQKNGLISRKPSPNDRRSVTLVLTKKGERVLDRLHVRAREHEEELDKLIGASKPRLIGMLDKITGALATA